MRQTHLLSRLQKLKQYKSLYDMGLFSVEQKHELTTLLDRLEITKYRPLILLDSSVVLQLDGGAVLLPCNLARLSAPTNVICGWKEKDPDGKENYCVGIMEEQVSVAGAYYRCRKNPEIHRTLK